MLPTMIVLFSTFFHFHYLLKYMSRKSLCHLVFFIIIMSCFYQLKVSYSSYFVWNQAKKKKSDILWASESGAGSGDWAWLLSV